LDSGHIVLESSRSWSYSIKDKKVLFLFYFILQ